MYIIINLIYIPESIRRDGDNCTAKSYFHQMWTESSLYCARTMRSHSSSAGPATGRNGSTARTVEGSKLETTHAATTSAPPTTLRWSRLSPSSRRPKRLAHKGSVATITDASALSVVETRKNSATLTWPTHGRIALPVTLGPEEPDVARPQCVAMPGARVEAVGQ